VFTKTKKPTILGVNIKIKTELAAVGFIERFKNETPFIFIILISSDLPEMDLLISWRI